MTETLEQLEVAKESKKESHILYGKKTISFPFIFQDLKHLITLLREDKFGYMGKFCLKKMTEQQAANYIHSMIVNGEICIWSVFTKEGKASRKAGYAYLTDITPFSCEVGGIMDMQFAKGLTKHLRADKYTFAEDAFRAMLKYCFEKANMERCQSVILEFNRRSMALDYKIGFKKEGILRKSFELEGALVNLHVFSLLKEEFKEAGQIL